MEPDQPHPEDANLSSSRPGQPESEASVPPQAIAPQPPTPSKPKAKPTAPTKAKQPKVAPLPATVEVRGYEITIPNTKTCWRVNVVHSCGHPVMEISEVRYPGCDRPLMVEINRHMRPCTDKCKVEAMAHTMEGLCGMCWQSKHQEREQASGFEGSMGVGGQNIVWDGLPRY